MEMLLSGRLKFTKYPERAKDVHSNNGIAWIGWVLGVLAVFFTASIATAQPNLVPNPSFEEFTDCPYSGGHIWKAEPWYRVRGSVDYYHPCGTIEWGAPNNWAGYQNAYTGEAYAGFLVYAALNSNAREYIGVPLKESLQAGQDYRVQFYVNLPDCLCFSVKNLGAYLSEQQPSDLLENLLELQPQVVYLGNTFLDDKLDWMAISGVFTAQGGENFITIGNFDDDLGTDTSHVNCVLTYATVGYYLDDVSVIPVDSLVGIGEREKKAMSIYPNPAQEYFVVETEQGHGGMVQLLDIAGRQVAVPIYSQSAGKWQVDIANIPPGIYLLEVHYKEVRKVVQKVVVQH